MTYLLFLLFDGGRVLERSESRREVDCDYALSEKDTVVASMSRVSHHTRIIFAELSP